MNLVEQTADALATQFKSQAGLPQIYAHHVEPAGQLNIIISPEAPSRPSVRAIIPALNEAASIQNVLAALPAEWVDEVLVVDNGSTDDTAEIAARAGATVVRQAERGYGAACLAGIAALDSTTEIVVFLDADFSDYPEDLALLLEPLLKDAADMVLSTRMQMPEARQALTPQQQWGNWLAVTLLRWRFGYRYSDLGPFRAIRYSALKQMGMQDRNYGWTVEMQIRAIRQGLRIVEVPMRYRVRIGRSKISGTIKGTILAGAKILYTIFRYGIL